MQKKKKKKSIHFSAVVCLGENNNNKKKSIVHFKRHKIITVCSQNINAILIILDFLLALFSETLNKSTVSCNYFIEIREKWIYLNEYGQTFECLFYESIIISQIIESLFKWCIPPISPVEAQAHMQMDTCML